MMATGLPARKWSELSDEEKEQANRELEEMQRKPKFHDWPAEIVYELAKKNMLEPPELPNPSITPPSFQYGIKPKPETSYGTLDYGIPFWVWWSASWAGIGIAVTIAKVFGWI